MTQRDTDPEDQTKPDKWSIPTFAMFDTEEEARQAMEAYGKARDEYWAKLLKEWEARKAARLAKSEE